MAKQFLPSTLEDINCFFRDESWAGVCNKVTLPDVEFKTEAFSASATGGEKEKMLKTLKAMKPKLVFSDINARIIGIVGNPQGKDEPFILRGSIDRDGVAVGIKVTMQGDWFKLGGGELTSGGQEATNEIEGSLDLYEIEIDGAEVLHVDIINKVYRTNGVDHFAAIRANLGL